MREPTKQSPGRDRPKPQKRREKPQATGNRRLAEQIRKILGQHYASKYRCGELRSLRLRGAIETC